MTYSEKLRDPRWQKKRLEILVRDNWQCCICDGHEKTLHVHHRRYARNTNPWDYADNMYSTLCESCHEEVTELKEEIGSMLDFEPHKASFERLKEMLVADSDIMVVITYIWKNKKIVTELRDRMLKECKEQKP